MASEMNFDITPLILFSSYKPNHLIHYLENLSGGKTGCYSEPICRVYICFDYRRGKRKPFVNAAVSFSCLARDMGLKVGLVCSTLLKCHTCQQMFDSTEIKSVFSSGMLSVIMKRTVSIWHKMKDVDSAMFSHSDAVQWLAYSLGAFYRSVIHLFML